MSHWLISANPEYYDVFAAFRQDETYWPINMKVSIADTIYIYLTAPYKQIGFACQVVEVDIDQERIFEHVRPFIKQDVGDKRQSKRFMKLKSISTISIERGSLLGLEHLRQNGLTGMLMGARKLENNPPLLDYISRVLV